MNNKIAVTTLAVALGLAACADNDTAETAAVPPTTDPAATTTPADPVTTTGTAPSDMGDMSGVNPTTQEREALATLNAVNEHEVAAGNQALSKNVSGEAADYARRMVEEHTRNRDMTARLTGNMAGTTGTGAGMAGTDTGAMGATGTTGTGTTDTSGVSTGMNADQDSAMAVEQRAKGEADLERLSKLDGDEYRRAYIEAMVNDHTAALAMLDDKLIPAATTPQVQEHLRQTREAIAAHLEEAQRLHKQEGG